MTAAKRSALIAMLGIVLLALTLGWWIYLPMNHPDLHVTLGTTQAKDVDADSPIWLVVIQLKIRPEVFESPETFAAWIRTPLQEALDQIPPNQRVLATYPEFCGLGLLFSDDASAVMTADSFEAAVKTMALNHLPGTAREALRHQVSPVRALLLTLAPKAVQTYVETFSTIAAEQGVTIAAGTMVTPPWRIEDRGRRLSIRRDSATLTNAAFLFGPDGRLLGGQSKVYLTDMEGPAGLDLEAGRLADIAPLSTPVGKVGLAVCLDAFHDDVISKLVNRGAEIIVQPSANPGVWHSAQQSEWLQSAWRAAQENPSLKAVVNPMMTGSLLDIRFEGQSAVACARTESAPPTAYRDLQPADGFLAVADTPNGSAILVVPLPSESQSGKDFSRPD